MHPLLDPILADQAGVISRRQALAAGLTRHDVNRWLRRRELAPLHPGVYVTHTGQLSWTQLAWAGVLLCWPAALAGQSALRAAEGPGSRRTTQRIEVAVARDRSLTVPSSVRVHRTAHLDARVLWHVGPPRLRYEEAALDVAAAATSDFDCLGELARAVQGRRTTAGRLLARLADRDRIARRDWIAAVLRDVADGACSVLEHGYLTRVERAHGLATARRQVRDRPGAGVVHRDVEYDGGLVVELDGRLFHDTAAQRDLDFDRDLDAAVAGKQSVRLSYGQVFDRGCRTAARIALLLRAHGWSGRLDRCPDCPS